MKEELKKWFKKKYKIKLLNGMKIFMEESVQLMLLISSVYKDNIFSIFLLVSIVFY